MKTYVTIILLSSIAIAFIIYFYCKPKESFVDSAVESVLNKKQEHGNPLYASSDPDLKSHILHVSPAGDKSAMAAAGVGVGTSGGFLPIQGNGAQNFMASSDSRNVMKESNKSGKIGGYPNYSNRDHISTRMDGVEDFGMPVGSYSNSHVINGASQRVEHGSAVHEDIYHPDFAKLKSKNRWERV